MPRVRISTTVDGKLLDFCRAHLKKPDSVLLDEALATLADKFASDHELAALEAAPYESDPDLDWVAPPGPDLPYDGEIPAEVLALAKQRRRAR